MKNLHQLPQDTVADLLNQRAKNYPNDIAYSFPESQQHFTWSRIWNDVQALAKGLLCIGVTKGDRIAIVMPDRMELVLTIFAAASIGAVAVPLNTYSKKKELSAYLDDARPTVIITGTECHGLHYPSLVQEIFDEAGTTWLPAHTFVVGTSEITSSIMRPFSHLFTMAEQVDDTVFLSACQTTCIKEPLILLYTSGTTGSPKGVVRSTASFLVADSKESTTTNRDSIFLKIGNKIVRHFSLMSLLPLYHLGGFSVLFTNLKACNVRIVMLSYFNPLHALRILEQEKSQFLVGTPFMIQRMLTSPKRDEFNLSSLLGLIFTSAAVSSTILQKIRQHVKIQFFMISYGSSEVGAVANGVCFMNGRNMVLSVLYKILTHTRLLSGLIKYENFMQCPYSLAGKVDKHVKVKIVSLETGEEASGSSQGEIVIRSHRVMQYYRTGLNRESFTHDGWYKSGDIGYFDENENLIITGRLRHLISRGGEKISPVEIENELLQHEDVEEVFVCGIPDEMYGEQICACVVAKDGTYVTAQQLQDFLGQSLSSFKVPRYVIFISHLPLTPSGKIDANEIKSLAIQQVRERAIYA